MDIQICRAVLLLVCGGLSSFLFADETLLPWSQDALSHYEAAEHARETLSPPETIQAERLFRAAQHESVERTYWERLACWDRKGVSAIRECAYGFLVLSAIQVNDPGLYRSSMEDLLKAFPESRYAAEFSDPSAFMKICPHCHGRCNQTVNCTDCNNTRRCALCGGKGKRLLRGMRRTRRVNAYDAPSRYTYNEGDSLSKPRLGSHRTNFSPGGEIVENNDRYIDCHRCRGTGVCLSCKNVKKGVRCDSCNNQGRIPDMTKLTPAFANLAGKGVAAAQAALPEERVVWDQSMAAQHVLRDIRQQDDATKILSALHQLIANYPRCAQRKACERLAATLAKAQREAEAAQRRVAEDTRQLTAALAEAQGETGSYRRREALTRLRGLYPKASNRAELSQALSLCEDTIEREEQAVRNAIELLKAVEHPKRGIEQANEIIREMDPICPLMGAVRSIREDFIERQRKADRNRHILYAVIGLVILLLIYFLFDLLNGIWQSRRHRW